MDLGDATSADLAVAVVDTGAARPGTLPAWLDTRADPVDARLDLESPALDPQVQGHGTFVASLIAQEAPQVHIVEARLSNVQDDSRAFWGELPKTAATGFVSDELQLYVAIARVLSVRDIRYSALNLSLGSYATTADPLRSGFGIRAAIDLWNRSTGDAPILAAAGNHEVGHAAVGPAVHPGRLRRQAQRDRHRLRRQERQRVGVLQRLGHLGASASTSSASARTGCGGTGAAPRSPRPSPPPARSTAPPPRLAARRRHREAVDCIATFTGHRRGVDVALTRVERRHGRRDRQRRLTDEHARSRVQQCAGGSRRRKATEWCLSSRTISRRELLYVDDRRTRRSPRSSPRCRRRASLLEW